MTGPIDWAEDDPDLRIPAEDMTLTPRYAQGGYVPAFGQQGDTVPLGPLQGESTSAALRRTQQDLAASQADLTEAQERHRYLWGLERDACVKLRRERDLARAELVSAFAELEQLRAQASVCRVTTCALCHRPVWCQEPREPMPGAAGYFQHVYCPEA